MVIVHLLVLIVGASMILYGANFMTSGATAVARRYGVSDFVIGLTLVAFGSSAPDLAVGVLSALKGHTQFAIGNVVGSDIFDGWLVTGCVALVAPFVVGRGVRERQLPMLLLAYVVVTVCANSVVFDGSASNVITRGDGIMMLVVFGLMMWMSLSAKPDGATSPAPSKAPHPRWSARQRWTAIAEIVGGLSLLVLGGNLFVDGASGVAKEAHLSETIIGLTVVALGTSLPDLATSVVAARRGHTGIAIGNVVGSCMFDALLVLGCSAVVRPLPLDGVSNLDLTVMISGGVLFYLISALRGSHRVGRRVGAVMVVVYAAYITYLVVQAAH